jgi:hypothetical protein
MARRGHAQYRVRAMGTEKRPVEAGQRIESGWQEDILR